MCEFCKFHTTSKSNFFGKMIKISEKSNTHNLSEAQVIKLPGDEKAVMMIYEYSGFGYFEIDYCPKCGRKLVE